MNKVYIVIHSTTERFSNDLCWDDGYYDDYYETEVNSEEIISVYSNYEDAQKEADRLNNESAWDDNYYVAEFEVK